MIEGDYEETSVGFSRITPLLAESQQTVVL